jgi:trk system potassium uptake protein TrkA
MKIKIIEQNRERAEMLLEKVPSNVTILLGDRRDADLLQNEGITESDAFIALTGNSEANILACLVAKQYGVRKPLPK